MILYKNNYEENEKLFSTGDSELDELLTEVYYSGLEDGYDYAQKEFTSKETKALRRRLLIDAADKSFEKEEATRLLNEGKIDQREWDRRVIKKGKERLGIEKPIVSDGGFTINLENIPGRSAGEVNSNFEGKYAKKGKSRLERKALKAETRRKIAEYRQGGFFGPIDTEFKIEELVEDAKNSGKLSDVEAKRIQELAHKGKNAQFEVTEKLGRKEELLKKAAKLEKKAKKAAPWVIGGTVVAAGTATGVKAIRKKKENKKKN